MLVEKYIIIGIKNPNPCVTDVVKQSGYGNSLIDPINVIRELRSDIFVDFDGPFTTKTKALNRLETIRYNVYGVMYWSILPVIVDVSLKEARYLKLSKIKRKTK